MSILFKHEKGETVKSIPLAMDWSARTSKLAQLNEEERRQACELIGCGDVYRYNFIALLHTDREYGFSKSIEILADREEDAESVAKDYFLAGNVDIMDYYKHLAEKENGSCSFNMERVLTQSQAARLNEEEDAFFEALEETELGMTL